MLSKVVSSSIFKVFGMTRPRIEPRSPGPLANTLTAGPLENSFMNSSIHEYVIKNDLGSILKNKDIFETFLCNFSSLFYKTCGTARTLFSSNRVRISWFHSFTYLMFESPWCFSKTIFFFKESLRGVWIYTATMLRTHG